MIKIIINGATGRMGATLIRLAGEAKDIRLVGAVDIPSSLQIGKEVCRGVQITGRIKELITSADVVIDFTSADATLELLETARGARKAVVVGTTGHTPEQRVMFKKIASDIPLLISPNMSVGVNLLWKLTELAGRTLDETYDVAIRERHHVHKKDSPSGTAKRLIEIATKTLKEPSSVDAVREGEVVGEHAISFTSNGEKIELAHYAFNREIFARGALKAAKWIAGRPPGLYDMQDVLF